jgi:alpha/beta superfamily hydrolase
VGEVRRLWLPGPAGRLEAALRVAMDPRGAALLTHPHPLRGGTLDNPVVFHADRELHRVGLTTLRFNFRGVGASDGTHDEGRGEVEDIAAAASWLRGLAAGVPLVVVGYSFGSWCAIRHAVSDDAVAGVIAIGLPVRIYPLTELTRLARPLAVVQGSADELGLPEEVRHRLRVAGLDDRVLTVEGADHLFAGRAADAASLVVASARAILEVGGGRVHFTSN